MCFVFYFYVVFRCAILMIEFPEGNSFIEISTFCVPPYRFTSQCYQQLIFVGFLAANEFMDFFDYYSPISNFAGFRDVPRF